MGNSKANKNSEINTRNSNIELFRIILMIFIIAHHYTVNSGLTDLYDYNNISSNMIFLQIFGMLGKTIINCFTIITGFYMVKSGITIIKFIKTYLEVKFYNMIFYILFILLGYEVFTTGGFIKTLLSVVYESGSLYISTYIILFLFIPVLNILANKMSKTQYHYFFCLTFIYFTFIPTFMKHETFDFLSWNDLFHNTAYFFRNFLIPHAIFTVILVYFACFIIDQIRFYILEKPLFNYLSKLKVIENLEVKLKKLECDK